MKKLLVSLMASAMMLTNAATATATTTSTKSIAQIAVESGSFKTLVAALTAADLVSVVSNPGSLTVFAPTDAAFAKLPAGTVESLLKDIPALKNILTYHVVAGIKSPKDLINQRLVTTLQGEKVKVQLYQGRLFVNESQIIMKPILASNGVIYVIDAVLLP